MGKKIDPHTQKRKGLSHELNLDLNPAHYTVDFQTLSQVAPELSLHPSLS